MNLRHFFSRHTVKNIRNINARALSSHSSSYRYVSTTTISRSPYFHPLGARHASSFVNGPKSPTFGKPLCRHIHSSEQINKNDSSTALRSESEDDASMNEFLSRFVWIMRKKLSEAYPDCDKNTVDGMLVIIVGKVVSEMEEGGLEKMIGSAVSTPSEDFSEDLWRTVWEVSNEVLKDMEKEKKNEKMKSFLQDEEVKEMYRFAGEVGIRGDMLRELRFKWAREKMEEHDFYQSLESVKEESETESSEDKGYDYALIGEKQGAGEEDKEKIVSLPKRHGKIKYKIYGLDLSDKKWAEVADRIHDSSEIIWPQEPKPISGKCKLVTDKILSLQEADDPAPVLGEWTSLLQPSRIDWITLLDRVKEKNSQLYFKIAELVLGEESFQANIRDYSKLIDALARDNRLEDAERILKKMNENGVQPDVITLSIVVHMYCKSGNLDRAKEAFESLRAYGFQPDMKVYNSMIVAYVNAGQPKMGESLMREMETRDIKPSREIYMALLQSFAQRGDVGGADRISTTMQFAGFQPTLESCSLMVQAYGQANNSDHARHHFDYLRKLGLKPDDRCTAMMVAAYEKNNLLDKALDLLLELEKDGFQPGVATYAALVDWLGKLELLDEAEQMLEKISEQGEAPPFKLHVSLCDMYARAGAEKKALQALGVLESKIDQLGPEEFERIIGSLTSGGFVQDARRMHGLMEARGFKLSDQRKIALMASQAVRKNSKSDKSWLTREN